MRLRVALVDTSVGIKGGEQRFLVETTKGLIHRGHDARLFLANYDSTISFPDFETIPKTIVPPHTGFFGRFLAYADFVTRRRLVMKATEWKADIILLNRGYTSSNYLSTLTKVPIIPYVHSIETLRSYRRVWYRRMYRSMMGISTSGEIAYDQVPFVICNSKFTERLVREVQPESKTAVVYPGVDLERFRPTWEDEGYVYCHGRISGRKNQALALRALAHTDYKLVISGSLEDSKLRRDYFESLKSIPSPNSRIELDIGDDDLIRYMQKCSIFLAPGSNEYFGLVAIEAMACGKVVLGHRSGGTIETVGLVSDFLLCGDDPDEWEAKIRSLMSDPERRDAIGKASYEVAKSLSWSETVAGLETLLGKSI